MTTLIDILHQDHKNYTTLLDLLNGQAKKLEQGEEPDFVLMYDILNYMVSYPDAYHHPHEELTFDILSALDPGCSDEVRRLNREHKQQAETGRALKDALDAVVNGAIVPLDRLLDNTNSYIELFKNHMNLEEGSIFPKARATLEDSEWQLINDRISQVEDPLFGDVVLTQYQKLYEGIMRSATA